MKKSTTIVCALAVLSLFLPAIGQAENEQPHGERHVVLVVWDGMRPDFITEANTPNLWKLAQEGVNFQHHHSVYPTATNVNGAAIATGVYPNRSTLLANREYRSSIDPRNPFENAEVPVITKADQLTGGKYIASPTIAEMVRAAGRSTAVVGTKAVAFVHDRHSEWQSGSTKSYVKFAASPMSSGLREETLKLLGPFPTNAAEPNANRDTYATRALTEVMWRDGVPAFSLLWLSDPDFTEHDTSPGSGPSVAAVHNSDRDLGLLLEALAQKKARESTDVFVLSDHGFSTIERSIDFPAELRKAGFDATSAFKEAPRRGQVMVVGNGGTILFYVMEHDRDVAARLVEWLQRSDFAGVIFAREKFEGAFPLETVRANTPEAPDVMVALRWNKNPNRFGTPGQIITDSARGPGEGSHATLSPFDAHNTLIAAGPDFRERFASALPSSNVDIAPTVLRILGIDPPQKFDGRVLIEGMDERAERIEPLSKTIQASRKFPSGEWHQYLRVSLVGETVYIDEGNGAFDASPDKP